MVTEGQVGSGHSRVKLAGKEPNPNPKRECSAAGTLGRVSHSIRYLPTSALNIEQYSVRVLIIANHFYTVHTCTVCAPNEEDSQCTQ